MIELETVIPTESISPELTLADQFQKEDLSGAVAAVPVSAVEGATEGMIPLPAALCDDRLLEELKSIPLKMGFKIGEVADLLGIKQYVLRYWESEFDCLRPKKASNNQRYYTKKDVENAFLIRKLLHRDRFSIEGARAAMSTLKNFAKKEVKRDIELNKFQSRFETLQDHVDDLILEIRRVKMLFT